MSRKELPSSRRLSRCRQPDDDKPEMPLLCIATIYRGAMNPTASRKRPNPSVPDTTSSIAFASSAIMGISAEGTKR